MSTDSDTDKLKLLFKEGMEYYETGSYRMALRKFKKILTLEPSNSVAKAKLEEIEARFQEQELKNKKRYKRAMVGFAITTVLFLIIYTIIVFQT